MRCVRRMRVWSHDNGRVEVHYIVVTGIRVQRRCACSDAIYSFLSPNEFDVAS